MMNLAVIGVGSMGRNHARVLSQIEGVTLKAIADPDEQQVKKICSQYHCKGYTAYQELLEDKAIDAVTIAVPTTLHQAVACAAAEKGKHILLEKPIASDEVGAKAIIAAARKNRVKLMIGHIERFNPAIQELKKRLEAGELGEIYRIDVQRIGPFPARVTDVGVITDLSVHDLDVIEFLTKAKVGAVYAETQQRLHPACEDAVTAIVSYTNGIVGSLNINYLSPTKIRQIAVFGKKGMFRANYLTQELYFFENNAFSAEEWKGVGEGDMKKITLTKKEPLLAEMEGFIACINKASVPPVTGEEGLKALQTANMLLQSAKEHRRVAA